MRLLQDNYYTNFECLKDNKVYECNYSIYNIALFSSILSDDMDKLIYEDIFIKGYSLTEFSKNNNTSYSMVYRRYLRIIEKIKKNLF